RRIIDMDVGAAGDEPDDACKIPARTRFFGDQDIEIGLIPDAVREALNGVEGCADDGCSFRLGSFDLRKIRFLGAIAVVGKGMPRYEPCFPNSYSLAFMLKMAAAS